MNIFKRSVSLLLALVLVLSLGTPAYAVSGPRMELEVSSQSIEATKTVEVTIKAYDIPKVFAMGFELHANNRIFETVSIDTNWSVSDQLAEKGYIRIATFDMTGDNLVVPEVIATVTLRATEDVEAADIWIEMQEAAYMDETMVDIAAPEKISIEVTPHTHSYTETVVAPTCTEKGYTLSACTCGDSEKSKYTDALGHNYENNVCTVCGAPGTVIPEGAKFTDMLTDKGEIVTVTEKDGYYLVEVPYGTTSLMVTYPEDLPKVDEFSYVTTRMSGFDGVSQDGYGFTRKDGKIIVGLALEKAPSNGAPTVVRLINLDNEYGKKITVCMADGSEETFALTYKLGNGQYFAVLPLPEDCVGYSITGEPIASDGYSFNVSILEGYEATENFAVKVNGQTVSNEPGRISIPSVTEDLKVTVEGVGKVQNNTTDVIFNVDLTAAPSGMWGDIMIQDKNSNFIEEPVASNQQSTAAIAANDHAYSKLRIYEIKTALITGWEVNGTVYPEGGKQYVGDLCIWNRGSYMQVEYNGTTPITVNVKPVFVEAPDGKYHVFHTAADEYTITGEPYAGNGYTFNVAISAGYRATSDFAVKVNGKTVATVPGDITLDTVSDHIVITVEGIAVLGGTITDNIPVIDDNISVRSIDIMKADVDSYQWDGDTLNVVLAEGTAPNATIKTKWTMDVRNTNDGAEYCEFIFNDDYLYCEASAGTLEQTMNVTLADGTATATAAFTMCDCDDPVWDITFTPKTYTVNFYVGEMPHIHDYESVVTPPTCTEGGYTTYTCKAGDDTYVAERVPALGHTNVNGTCSVCGASLTVIPEGATFLDMMTSDGKAVTVTDLGTDPFFGMGKLYKVEVPVGTIQVNITLDQSKVYVDEFGYAKTMMQGFDNVSEDGYGQTTKDGKVTVGLQMEKAPANGSSSTIRLLNVPYPEDVNEVKAVGLLYPDFAGLDFYAFTYMLAEGQYYANLPDSFMYTVTGDGVASNGYKFNVSINNGYEATEDFAVRVNGEIVATQPGEVTVASVTEDLTITVEGVNKIYNPETDVSITVDLTEYTGEIEGQLWFNKKSGPSYTADLVPGKNNTIILEASDLWQMFANIYSIGSDVIGYDINGEIRDPGYLSFGFNVRDNAQPGKYVIKPVVGSTEPEQPESNPITEIELAHPNFVKDEQTGEVSMTMVTGTSEQIDLSYAVANEELDATQVILWTSSDPETASVENGKVTAHKAGTVTITAKAVDASGIALAAEEDEVLAKFTLNISDPTEGYTVNMGADKNVVANETIQIPVTVTHSDSTVTGYKSFEFTFQYDPNLLTLNNKSAENDEKDVTIVDDNGTVTVRRYGEALNVGEAAITLEFTAKQTCETNVKLTAAKVGTSADAQGENIPVAQIVDNITLVTVSGYTVKLPDEFDGETVVAPGAAYTFEAKNKNYTYTVKATIDGQPINVTANEDGTVFTIAEGVINGNVTIEVVSETGKKFAVAITGEGAAELAPAEGFEVGEDAAQYMVDYKAVLTPAAGYDYDVNITIGTEKYSCTPDENNVYTIAGSAITGDISIEVTKTASSVSEHDVTFSGNGVEDLVLESCKLYSRGKVASEWKDFNTKSIECSE